MKDYKNWHQIKKILDSSERKIIFHTREIWWCALGENIGFEQDGKNRNFERPVLVFRKFNKYVLWVLPLTKTCKKGDYYCSLEYKSLEYSVILTQIRLICSKRLLRRIRTLPNDDFKKIRASFKKLL